MMKLPGTATNALLLLALFCGGIGCSNAPESGPEASSADKAARPQSSAAAGANSHAHPVTGPHGGPLIELGKEDYHAELIHDEEAQTVTVYLLDSSARKPVAISAETIRINLKHGGKAEQFLLRPVAHDEDEPGHASRFTSTDEELCADLDHESVEARLVVEINGRSFSGRIRHDHGHDHHEAGHDHKH